ncbi:2-aminoadipate transaminase [compost metagenome]
MLRLKQSADLHTSRVGQWQVLQWLGTEKLDRHLEELRSYYRGRRDAFQAALETHFADLAEWQMPEGGLFFWLTLKHPIDTRALLEPALAANVAFMPGEPFFPEPDKHPGHLRLNFSHVAPDKLDEGLKRLSDVLRRALSQQAA